MNYPAAYLAGLGGMILGVVITKNILERAYEERFETERRELEEYYQKTAVVEVVTDIQPSVEEVIERNISDFRSVRPPVAVLDFAAAFEKSAEIVQESGYAKYHKGYTAKEGDAEITEDPVSSDIKIITQDAYFSSSTPWPQVTLTYFIADDVLMDENDERIWSVTETIGDLCWEMLKNSEAPYAAVYVSNEILRIEYEIILDTNSFAETILGVKDLNSGG